MNQVLLMSDSPVSRHMETFNVVALKDLALGGAQPRRFLDNEVHSWSSGGRDNLPKTGVVGNTKIRF